jgi:hypothetical protein
MISHVIIFASPMVKPHYFEGGWAKWRSRTIVIKITSGARGACYFRHELLEGRGLDGPLVILITSASRCGGIFVPSIFYQS